jgi:metal-responsive CopG/Arc/MetJ family transcriptional regulator
MSDSNDNEPAPSVDLKARHLHVLVPEKMIAEIDQLVGRTCIDRSEAIRRLLSAGLAVEESRR